MNNRRINLQKLLSLGYNIKINDGHNSTDPYTILVDRNITDLEFDKIIDDKLQKITIDYTWLTDVKLQSSSDICLVCKKLNFKYQFDMSCNSIIIFDDCEANHFQKLPRKFREKINYCKNFEI